MAAFTPGNLVVYRVGSGSGSLVNTGNPVFLDEYTPSGTLVQSIALPTADSGANQTLIASGTATSEGLLTLSADGHYLLLTGYDAPIPTSGLAGTASSVVNRVVGRVDAAGNVDTTTALSDAADGNNIRSVASTNGIDIWVAGGTGGVRYTQYDGDATPDTSTQLSTTVTNIRQVEIFNGQLYISTGSGSVVRIGAVGSGEPTTSGQTITNLPGFPTSGSPYAFFLADLTSAVAGVDTLYVAEDTAGGGQVQKYSLVSGSWVSNGVLADPSVRGLTASVSGSSVTLFTTTGGGNAAGGGSLDTFTDTSGYNATITGTLTHLASASANTAFRGVAFAPVAADTTAPTLSSSAPADNATGVAASANIVLNFSEDVKAGTGNVTITGTDGDVRSIAITDATQVTISGSTVTINPTADLHAGIAYDVTLSSGVITDMAGNAFAGIAPDALDFTIMAAAPANSISLTALDTAYTQNFDTLSNTAGTTTNNLSILGWSMTESGGGARDNEQYAVDTGGSGTGDTYSYGDAGSTDRALGGLRSGTLIPTFGAFFYNATDSTITSLDVSYMGEQWRLGNAGRTDQLNFEYSTNATDLSSGTWSAVPNLAFVTPNTVGVGAKNGNVDHVSLSATITGLNIAPGETFFVRWTDTDASGADDGLAVDDFSLTPHGAVQGPTVSIADASITEGDNGTKILTFTVTRSDTSTAFTVDYATANGTATTADNDYVANSGTLTFTAGGTATQQISVTINGDTASEPDETFTVNLSNIQNTTGATTISDGSATGTILNDDVTITKISTIQGTGSASLLVGQMVTIDAIVVGDFQNGDDALARNLDGFYLEEEIADWDGNPLTSEGIFVFQNGRSFADVHVGDHVRVTGTISEFFGLTELTLDSLTIESGGLTLAQVLEMATPITLSGAGATTTNQDGDFQPDLEAYEGMLVSFPQTLTITEQFNLDRFNEIKLSQGGRLETFANEFEPDTAAYAAYLQQIGARTITYDDGLNVQNASINNLDGFDPNDDHVGQPGYGTATAPRMGDTITGLSGVLDYQWAGASASGATWRVRSIYDGENTFTPTNARPATPDDVGGTLKVGSFNVLNYFRTLNSNPNDDTTNSDPSDNTPIGLDSRGANTLAEFNRQTEKLVNTILALNADVLGLTELENEFQPGNPANAIEYLVAQLNLKAGAGTYAWINPGDQLDQGQFFGGDAIAVGFIYKTAAVHVAAGTTIQKLDDADVDPTLLAQSSIGRIFNGPNTSRAALAVTFEQNSNGEQFTAVINHLKSKSGTGTGADADQHDGQGNWQQQRELAAKALTEWIATHPTGTTDNDVLLLGDFNAYLKEDAIDIIKAAGFTNIAEARLADPYSYVFDAQAGALDHALASASLNGQVTGVTEWHVNADEADALDYNLDFGRDPDYFDGTIPARESDHDPVLIGLALDSVGPHLTSSSPPDNATGVLIGDNIVLTFDEAVQAGTGNITLHPATGADIVIPIGSGQVTFNGNQVTINPTADLRAGVHYDVLIDATAIKDAAGNLFAGTAAGVLDFTTSFIIPAGTFSQTFSITDPGTFTLLAGTTRTQTAGVGVTANVPSGSTTIDIEGTLVDTASGQRAMNATLSAGGQIIIGAQGSVQSLNADTIRVLAPNAKVDLTNLGQIISGSTLNVTPNGSNAGTGFALTYNAVVGANGAPATDYTSGGVITNGAAGNMTALIQSNSGDAIRMGSHMTLINYGTIKGNGPVNDSNNNNGFNSNPNDDGAAIYDISRGVRFNQDGGTAGKVENYGTIEGAQHGVDIGQATITNIVINNHAGGTILGHNGSGVGADTTGAAANTVTVENFGTIRGEYAPTFDRVGFATVDGDADGVDVDGAATIINHQGATIAGSGAGGVLNGQGAGGYDSGGRANNSEGISIGGGIVVNDGLISGANYGITVNNDSNPNNSRSGVLATTITNGATGTIIGQAGFAIRLENKTGTASIDNDTIVNSGTIIGNGTIPDPNGTVLRQNGLADPGVQGTLDGVTYTSAANAGSARFISGDGSAIQMGEGDDLLTNFGTITGNTGRAVNMEGGNDTLEDYTGSTITGRIDGGAGSDTLKLLGTGSGTLANVINFETLAVVNGTWTVSDEQAYSDGVTIGAAKLLLSNGSITAAVAVNATGTLGGSGNIIGAVTVAANATLSPGASAGVLSTGNLSFASGATYKVEIGGASFGQYDEVKVTGTVNLGGATLAASLLGGFNPDTSSTTAYIIIDNDGADAVTGTFAGLAEGALVNVGTSQFTISYHGGDGNDVVLTAVNNAPVNTVPGTQNVNENSSLAIAGLSVSDVDAGAGVMTTKLSVEHGTLTVGAVGGAAVSGSGSATVTVTGTQTQINATLSAANNVVYVPTHDFDGNDTLTITTNDNGNSGSGGPLSDTDTVKIVVANTTQAPPVPVNGTPGDDAFTAPAGDSAFNGLGGIDTITFGFKLTDAKVSYSGNQVIIDGPSNSHTVLTGFEIFKFTDGTVNNNDADLLVDDLFYYSKYHDVWNAHLDADTDFHTVGWKAGRDPDAFFSVSTYLSKNTDVKAAGIDPLLHFDQFGWKEGRPSSILFDPAKYLAANPDVKAAHVDPLTHFLQYGAGEGRQPIAPTEIIGPNGFDYVYYLQHNPDVAAAGIDPFVHFENTGWKEGRNPNAYFDTTGYLTHYADVMAAHVNPLDHYNQSGWKEGRDPSVSFDTTDYLSHYPDVAAAHVNPLIHFLTNGIHEGRSSFADGVWG